MEVETRGAAEEIRDAISMSLAKKRGQGNTRIPTEITSKKEAAPTEEFVDEFPTQKNPEDPKIEVLLPRYVLPCVPIVWQTNPVNTD